MMNATDFRDVLRRAFEGLARAAVRAGRPPTPSTIAVAQENGFGWNGQEFFDMKRECELRLATNMHRPGCLWCTLQRLVPADVAPASSACHREAWCVRQVGHPGECMNTLPRYMADGSVIP